MKLSEQLVQDDCCHWLCPDLTPYWRLGSLQSGDSVVLQALSGQRRLLFSAAEGYALRYFTGHFSVAQVQHQCLKRFGSKLPTDFVKLLLLKLVELEILVDTETDSIEPDLAEFHQFSLPTASNEPDLVEFNQAPLPTASNRPRLKACVQWIAHPDGYWILRNPEDVTFLQVNAQDKAVIEQLGQLPPAEVATCRGVPPEQLRYLLQLLAATAMLEGTKPPKPPRKKFTPMQLLFFKLPLFNPDGWLNQPAALLRWIWTKPFFGGMCFFLAFSTVFGWNARASLLLTGQTLVQTPSGTLMLLFALLAMLVVTLHELGHALTLKHYGGIVPEVGLLFMFLMPAAYTNTSDAYCLTKRRQRVLVVAAGVLTQLAIGANAFWLWQFSVESSWLCPTSYLLLVASLFTVAVNLNPLAKFDGYYLAVALTGINNLRSRSFGFYGCLLQGKPVEECPRDRGVLAAYAPLSLLYTLLVFGSLFFWLAYWIVDHIPMTALVLLLAWAIYYFFPRSG